MSFYSFLFFSFFKKKGWVCIFYDMQPLVNQFVLPSLKHSYKYLLIFFKIHFRILHPMRVYSYKIWETTPGALICPLMRDFQLFFRIVWVCQPPLLYMHDMASEWLVHLPIIQRAPHTLLHEAPDSLPAFPFYKYQWHDLQPWHFLLKPFRLANPMKSVKSTVISLLLNLGS